jgi:CO/xanthine dehydrogenase Mo-binding subunit
MSEEVSVALTVNGRPVPYFTNNVPLGSMRGFGVNQVSVAPESHLDEIAHCFGIDRFEFRLINAVDDGIPIIVEVPHPDGPLGARGFAEGPSLSTAPAILNAICDAVGVRIRDLTATKAKIAAALQEQAVVQSATLGW